MGMNERELRVKRVGQAPTELLTWELQGSVLIFLHCQFLRVKHRHSFLLICLGNLPCGAQGLLSALYLRMLPVLCRGHVGLMIVKRVLSPLSHFQVQVYEVLLFIPGDLVSVLWCLPGTSEGFGELR